MNAPRPIATSAGSSAKCGCAFFRVELEELGVELQNELARERRGDVGSVELEPVIALRHR
jgi:hypothetical protein